MFNSIPIEATSRSVVESYQDWMKPEERTLIEKYLAGKAGIPTEHRLRAIRTAKDLIGHGEDGGWIHTEGSLAAQKMAIFAAADWDRYKDIAKRIAGIPGWKDHPDLNELPDWSDGYII